MHIAVLYIVERIKYRVAKLIVCYKLLLSGPRSNQRNEGSRQTYSCLITSASEHAK